MKTVLPLLILSLFSISCSYRPDSKITLNSVGYLPGMPKTASITSECVSFKIKNVEKNEIVLSGNVTGPFEHADFDEKIWNADFSEINQNGKYILEVPGVGQSSEFEIKEDVYNFSFVTSMRAFYLWRCGTALEGVYDSNTYLQAECHMNDGFTEYIDGSDSVMNGTGGWHDAGDYGKYTSNAGLTVGTLFFAWEHFKYNLESISLNLPDTAPGYPDFLKEIKWEIDWLLKMQYPDNSGRVSHKLTALNFSGFIKAEDDTQKRFFTEWSSTATADFAAMMAMASRHFEPYDPDYAEICLEAAIRSYNVLSKYPDNKSADLSDFKTGAYASDDADDRLWAMIELWETTGNQVYLENFESKIQQLETKFDYSFDWGNIKNLAIYTYLLSEREGKNPSLIAETKKELLQVADRIVEVSKSDIYGRPFDKYFWGCNGAVARQTMTLQAANIISPNPEYINTALDAVSHLLGRNHYGRSYITGLGYLPPMNPHDRRSGSDDIAAPWPGYLVGGGETSSDWSDKERDFRTNEIAINWQAALVYALAGFVE